MFLDDFLVRSNTYDLQKNKGSSEFWSDHNAS